MCHTYSMSSKAPHALDKRYTLKFSTDLLINTIEDLLRKHVTQPTEQGTYEIDLLSRPYAPQPLNQGQLGACASHAAANSYFYTLGREKVEQFHPSRLALYYNTRVLVEGSPAEEDTGVTISDLCTAIQKYHVCPETDWEYDVSKFSLPPPPKALSDEARHLGFAAHAVTQDKDTLTHCLLNEVPVMFGIQVYESFESEAVAETGNVPVPDTANEQCLGGHALAIYGVSYDRQAFLVLNSWGSDWGNKGTCWIPFEYVLDPRLAADFHVMTVAT